MIFPLLAQTAISDVVKTGTGLFGANYEPIVLGGSLFLVILISTIVVVVIARKKKKRRHRYSHPRSNASLAETPEDSSSAPEQSRRKKRRRRRLDRPLNPTLAQTGGLPPMRDENTPLPPMP